MQLQRTVIGRASVMVCLLALAGAARPQAAVEGSFGWLGATSAEWFDASNWDVGGTPNSPLALVTVHPASFAAAINSDSQVDLGTLSITSGASMELGGGALRFQSIVNPALAPTFTNHGTFLNTSGSLTLESGHVLSNVGSFSNLAYGTVSVDVVRNEVGGTLINEATWSHNQLYASGGSIQNRGQMFGAVALSQAAQLDNHNFLEGHSIDVSDAAAFHNHVGAVVGGEINLLGTSAVFINEGTVETAGLNAVAGRFENRAGATLISDTSTVLNAGASLVNHGQMLNSGEVLIAAGASLTGSGSFVQTGGVLSIEGSFSQGHADIQGGQVIGDGSFNGHMTLGADAQYIWRSGSQLVINPGAALEVAGSLNLPASGTPPVVVNQGSFTSLAGSNVDWGTAVGSFTVQNHGSWTNYSVRDDVTGLGGARFVNFHNGASGTVENYGTWEHVSLVSDGGVISNWGHVSSGPSGIVLNGGAQLVNHGFLSGRIEAHEAAVIDNWGSLEHKGNSAIALYDNSVFRNRAGGVINGPLNLAGTGGKFVNEGTINGNNYYLPGIGAARFENREGGTINAQGVFWARDMHSWGTINVASRADLAVTGLHLYNGSHTTINGSMTVNANAVVLDAGAMLENRNLVVNHETVDNGGTVNTSGSFVSTKLYNRETGLIDNTGTFSVSSSKVGSMALLSNDGVVNNRSAFYVGTAATLTNQGLFNHAAGVLTNNGAVVNSGTFLVGSGATVGFESLAPETPALATFTQTAGLLSNDGVMNQKLFDIQGGVVNGNGIFNGDFILGANAQLRPGHSPGSITINGNFTQLGKIVLEISGAGTGQYDVLNITGSATFNQGVIELSFIDGYRPTAGAVFDFFDVAQGLNIGTGVVIEVAGLGEGYHVTVDNGTLGGDFGQLTINSVTAVPEPETYAMLLVGLAVLGGFKRRTIRQAVRH